MDIPITRERAEAVRVSVGRVCWVLGVRGEVGSVPGQLRAGRGLRCK